MFELNILQRNYEEEHKSQKDREEDYHEKLLKEFERSQKESKKKKDDRSRKS